MSDPAIIGVVGVILGVILGWALNWWTTQLQERRRERQERRNVRMLLRLECRQNVASLLEYWDKVSSAGVHLPGEGVLVGIGTSHEEGEFDKRQRLAREPLPVWRRLMWERQADKAAMALKDATEIDRVYTLYADVEMFTARREELRAVFDTPEGKKVAEDYRRWMLTRMTQQGNPAFEEEHGREVILMAFNGKTRSLWDECQAVYNRVFPYRNSNVLEEDAPIRRGYDRITRARAARGLGTSKHTETK